jgi:2',3'-cyclic-nucleotide 2'-phosphodiesterase (5'-nucleotidase family)
MKRLQILFSVLVATMMVASAVVVVVWNTDGGDMAGEVVIVHTNDTHGFFDENLGFTDVAAVKDHYEKRGATVFTLDAGDMLQGTASTYVSQGETAMEVFNSVGYDVTIPGNHDFDYGRDRMLELYGELNCQVLCANIVEKSTGKLLFQPYTVLERNGVRLGVFGLITPSMATLTRSSDIEGLEFTDPCAAASMCVAALEAQHADYIVAIGHLGVQHSQSSVTSDDVCAEVPGIDIFIDGHSHTAMAGGKVIDGSVILRDSDTVIASTGSYIKAVGVVEIDGHGNIDARLEAAACGTEKRVDTVVTAVRQSQESLLSKALGATAEDLDGERADVRTKETNFGDLVADILRDRTGADVAIVNGGMIRTSIAAGGISFNQLYTAIPFENWVQTKQVTGAVIRQAVEHGLSQMPAAFGGFLQQSGMQIVYDASQPAGSRVISIKVNGEVLDDDQLYTVVASDYIFGGGDGYSMLSDGAVIGEYGMQNALIVSYLKEHGTIGPIAVGRTLPT